MRTNGVWLVGFAWLGLAAGACKKQSRQHDAPPRIQRDAAIIDAAPPDADPFGALPVIDDIPPITLEPANRAATTAAKKLASDALKRHLAGDLAGALPIYKQALAQDPGHLMARYNLASAYAKLGENGRALALLKQFKDLNCAVCLGRLARSRKDREWEALWKDPTFAALTERTVVPNPNRAAVTLRLAEAFRNGDAGPIADLLHPRDPIVIEYSEMFCVHDDCGLGDSWKTERVVGAAKLTAWLKGHGKRRHADDRVIDCDDRCCGLTDKTSHFGAGHVNLLVVCFHTDSGGVSVPDSLIIGASEPSPYDP